MEVVILIVVAVIGFGILKGLVRGAVGKTRSKYNQAERLTGQAVQEGKVEYPSWIHDTMWTKSLVDMTVEAAMKAGMTKDQAAMWFKQQDVADAVMTCAAQMEKVGFNKPDQISGAYEFTHKLAAAQLRRM